MTAQRCAFTGNSATSYHWAGAGGAIYLGSAGGHPTFTDCTFAESLASANGGAIFNEGSSATYVRATFTRNEAAQGGGAIYSYWGDTTLTSCTFTENTADWGGAVYDDHVDDPTVRDCTFTDNVALHGGGAIYHRDGDWTLIRSTFDGNRGGTRGGAIVSDDGRPRVTSCTFTANTAETGGAIHSAKSEATVINSVFLRNDAQAGAGIYVYRRSSAPSTLTLANCTFAENTAPSGRAIALDSLDQAHPSVARIANAILWNGGDEIWNNDASTIDVTFSDVAGGHPGVGNLEADPVCDADGRPQAGSPCIDAGATNAVPADRDDLDEDGDVRERVPIDLDGSPRFMDDWGTPDTGCGGIVVDMGAYEAPGVPLHPARFGDVDGDGEVGFADLLEVLSSWGACDPACCPADVDYTWEVGFDDLLIVLGEWT